LADHRVEMRAISIFVAVALASAAEVSVIELRSSKGLPVERITYDGSTLHVPQQCREKTCDLLNTHKTNQLEANRVFADQIQTVSDKATTNANGLDTLGKAASAQKKWAEEEVKTLKENLDTTAEAIRGELTSLSESTNKAIREEDRLSRERDTAAEVYAKKLVDAEAERCDKKVANLEKMITQLTDTVLALEKASIAEDEDLASKIVDLKNTAQELQEAHEADEKALAATQEELAKEATKLHELNEAEDDRLTLRLKKLEDDVDEKMKALSAVDDALGNADANNSAALSQLAADMEKEDKALDDAIKQAKKEHADAIAEANRVATGERAALSSSIDLVRGRVSILEDDVAATNRGLREGLSDVRTERSKIVATLRNEASSLSTDVDTRIQASIDTLELATNTAIAELESQTGTQLDNLQTTLSERVGALEVEHKDLNDFTDSLSSQFRNAVGELQDMDTKIRNDADSATTKLNTAFTDFKRTISAELSTETQSRKDADTSIRDTVDTEKQARQDADAKFDEFAVGYVAAAEKTLTTMIDDLAATFDRNVKELIAKDTELASADNTLKSNLAQVEDALDTETKERIGADTKLRVRIQEAEENHADAVAQLRKDSLADNKLRIDDILALQKLVQIADDQLLQDITDARVQHDEDLRAANRKIAANTEATETLEKDTNLKIAANTEATKTLEKDTDERISTLTTGLASTDKSVADLKKSAKDADDQLTKDFLVALDDQSTRFAELMEEFRKRSIDMETQLANEITTLTLDTQRATDTLHGEMDALATAHKKDVEALDTLDARLVKEKTAASDRMQALEDALDKAESDLKLGLGDAVDAHNKAVSQIGEKIASLVETEEKLKSMDGDLKQAIDNLKTALSEDAAKLSGHIKSAAGKHTAMIDAYKAADEALRIARDDSRAVMLSKLNSMDQALGARITTAVDAFEEEKARVELAEKTQASRDAAQDENAKTALAEQKKLLMLRIEEAISNFDTQMKQLAVDEALANSKLETSIKGLENAKTRIGVLISDLDKELAAQVKEIKDKHAADVKELRNEDLALAETDKEDQDAFAKLQVAVDTLDKKLHKDIADLTDTHENEVGELQAIDGKLQVQLDNAKIKRGELAKKIADADTAHANALKELEEKHAQELEALKQADKNLVDADGDQDTKNAEAREVLLDTIKAKEVGFKLMVKDLESRHGNEIKKLSDNVDLLFDDGASLKTHFVETMERIEKEHADAVTELESADAAVRTDYASADDAQAAKLKAAMEKADGELSERIAEATRKHNEAVQRLEAQDKKLAASAEQKVSDLRNYHDLEAAEQDDEIKRVENDAHRRDTALEAAIDEVKVMQSKLLGGKGSSQSKCSGTTFGAPGPTLCLVRAEQHGGVTGVCDKGVGWCSYRCNNGQWRGANGCGAQ